MQSSIVALSALLGTVVGGLISYFLQKQKNNHDVEMLREEYKTEFMAENTVKHFLSHKQYTDRSFEVLRKHLGGFEDDELRKILVRAGAIRTLEGDGEKWRLLERNTEYINKQRAKKGKDKYK